MNWFAKRSLAAPLLCAVALTSCSRRTKPIDVEKLLQDFIGATLAMSPVTATQFGFHDYEGVSLDSILDDYSERGVRGFRVLYNTMHVSADKLDSASLPAESRTDLAIIRDFCEMQLLDLDKIETYKHNPTMYVELLGQAVNGPFTLNYASEGTRWKHIIARLGKFRQFLATAKSNLQDSPEIWTTVAQAENQGNISLIDHDLRAKVPQSLRASFDPAAQDAIAALNDFNNWLETTLKKKPRDWRLGKPLYDQKFRYQLTSSQTPEQVLAAAEARLSETRARMKQQATALWPAYFRGRALPVSDNALISAVLGKIAERHAKPGEFFNEARTQLQQTTDFIREHRLLTLPDLKNLQIVPTPEFMRGIYGVGGFQPAPALQPQLGAFFWITPITPDMTKEEIEGKLREYNHWGLATLVIHEAMPGHYVQFQVINQMENRTRSVLRQLVAPNPNVEGWAVYATQLMIDEGYMRSPEMQLTFDKQMLRVIANTILDVKMQTQGMTDDQALSLMVDQTFQEKQEAVLKIRRAKLSSCQLPSYFVGWQGWLALRAARQAAEGSRFSLAAFHDAALREGGLPLPLLGNMLRIADSHGTSQPK